MRVTTTHQHFTTSVIVTYSQQKNNIPPKIKLKKIIYNIVADINGILEHNDKRGTKYLDGRLD